MTTETLQAPERSSSRRQAQELLRGLPADLTSAIVVLNCAHMSAAAPSFVDELVKDILEIRGARELRVLDASDRLRSHFGRSALLRQVVDRLVLTASDRS